MKNTEGSGVAKGASSPRRDIITFTLLHRREHAIAHVRTLVVVEVVFRCMMLHHLLYFLYRQKLTLSHSLLWLLLCLQQQEWILFNQSVPIAFANDEPK